MVIVWCLHLHLHRVQTVTLDLKERRDPEENLLVNAHFLVHYML